MAKVGIMTMQRVPNNGSFLQAYSLKKNIESFGCEAIFVDYEPGPVIVSNSGKKKSNKFSEYVNKLKKHFLYPQKNNDVWNKNCREFKKWEDSYSDFIKKELNVTKERNYLATVDMLVIGSDEVFNVLQPNPNVGYAKQLFGYGANAGRIISYGASFGNSSLNGLCETGVSGEVAGLLRGLNSVSVRDKNSVDIVDKLIGVTPYYHIDPVFLYDFGSETQVDIDIKNYIVVYAYSGRLSQKESRAILKFAKAHNKKIVCLAGAQEFIDGFIPTNPFESLAYVKNADYVITDTFHGTVFSIKYNKPFATIVRNGEGASYGNSNKLTDLLERFGLENHILTKLNNLETVLTQNQDYSEVNKKISAEKANSISYLHENYLECIKDGK